MFKFNIFESQPLTVNRLQKYNINVFQLKACLVYWNSQWYWVLKSKRSSSMTNQSYPDSLYSDIQTIYFFSSYFAICSWSILFFLIQSLNSKLKNGCLYLKLKWKVSLSFSSFVLLVWTSKLEHSKTKIPFLQLLLTFTLW